jgi:CMP-2-keto-3-deoxyoctulosonic acid synthetase
VQSAISHYLSDNIFSFSHLPWHRKVVSGYLYHVGLYLVTEIVLDELIQADSLVSCMERYMNLLG